MAMGNEQKTLKLKFHGKIIDHLGIQMYQSPVASLAELVANAWDADAELVTLTLPEQLTADSTIVIKDTGLGMTMKECEDRYLNIGYCRRTTPTDKTKKNRPVLGRKGIGKFAGFGIAGMVKVETTSGETGERTVFIMHLSEIRSDQYYADGGTVPLVEHLPPCDARKSEQGTTITLSALTLSKKINSDQFAQSMARRFLLHQQQEDFKVLIDGKPLPEALNLAGVEYMFPRDYAADEKPAYLSTTDEQGWGIETVTLSKQVRWRFSFHKETIDEEELRGIVVFVKGKVAQTPFLFNIAGGLKGQHGVEYLSGQVDASFLDDQVVDLVSTDRQSINWEHEESRAVLLWGAQRVKELLKLWQDRRGEERRRQLEEKLGGFADRLSRMTKTEARTIKTALSRLGSISTLTDQQFQELGGAMLTSFEQGRLKNLIDEIANTNIFSAEAFVEILAEADILSALNLAEVIRTKLEAIRGLERLIEKRELENKVRDYIAERPWLLNPMWETYKKETSLRNIMDDAAKRAGLTSDALGQRLDLALRSSDHVLIVEFMRPGKPVDWDHLHRCQRYLFNIRATVKVQTALNISRISGLLVADALDEAPDVRQGIESMEKDGIQAFDWNSLLSQANRQWREYLDIVVARTPEDKRVSDLRGVAKI